MFITKSSNIWNKLVEVDHLPMFRAVLGCGFPLTKSDNVNVPVITNKHVWNASGSLSLLLHGQSVVLDNDASRTLLIVPLILDMCYDIAYQRMGPYTTQPQFLNDTNITKILFNHELMNIQKQRIKNILADNKIDILRMQPNNTQAYKNIGYYVIGTPYPKE